MRIITITVLVAVFGIASTTSAKAQFGVQAGVLAPTGDWGDIWGAGFGGQVFYKKSQGDNITYGGSIGYFSLPGETINFGLVPFVFPDANVIPILGTFDYQINDLFYVGGDAGYNVISIGDLDQGITTTAESSLALIPKAGVKYSIFHAEARLNIVGDSYFSLVVGLSLGGKSSE